MSEEQQQLPPAPLLAHETLSSRSSATGAPVSLLTSSTSNRESPSCPDSTTSPSPLMTSMAAASTAPAGVPVSLPTGIAASTPGSVASNLKHAGGGPQVTTAHALALLPTLYSAYPAAAAAAAAAGSPPGLFSYIAAGLLPPPPTHPLHSLATSEVSRSVGSGVKRPIAHLASSGLPPLI